MTRPEHLAALSDLGYNEQESRFLYLVATHSGYFTLRQFLDYTGTSKGWNVHQFTSKSIRLGHVRAPLADTGHRSSTSFRAKSTALSTAITCAIAAAFRVNWSKPGCSFWTSFWPILAWNISKPKPRRSSTSASS